ncbi:YceI family protein [Sungkyunkwania multivorans]|uniref:YceI family protein n=1 Tax=Sungkyunkwania multivorans TaxID=1173618 RepID=A0ABW3CYE3_9FLAO
MKLLHVFILLALITGTSIQGQRIEVVTENAEAAFTFVAKEVEGTIGEIKATIVLDDTDLENASFSGTANIGTINTSNFLRDKHLMWKKYFYKKMFPEVSFKSTAVEKLDDDMYAIMGMMTLRGRSREVRMEFTIKEKELRGFSSINIADFGVNVMKQDKDNRVDIKFTFPLEKPIGAAQEKLPEAESDEEGQ